MGNTCFSSSIYFFRFLVFSFASAGYCCHIVHRGRIIGSLALSIGMVGQIVFFLFSLFLSTVFELFTLFTLFPFLFSYCAKNSFASPPRQHVYGFPPRHIPQIFPGHFEKFLDAFGAGACRCYIRYASLANVAFGRVSYTGVPAHRMVSTFLIQYSDFII